MSTQIIEQQKQDISLGLVISTNIKVALAVRDKKQTDLARALGVSGGLISQKIKGTTSWTIADMEKIGQFFKIAPAKFLEPNGLLAEDYRTNEWGRRGLNPGPGDYESHALTD